MKFRTTQHRNAFTLIELLVVIAIIALLMGLIFPALNSAIRSTKINKARSEAENIAIAVEMFYKEYKYLPCRKDEQALARGTPGNLNSYPEQGSQYFNEEESKRILMVLMASDSGSSAWDELNYKGKVFLDMETLGEDGTLLDPWGTQYLIKLDRDLDQKLEYYSMPEQYRTRVIVVSAGPDRSFSGGTDDEEAEDNISNVELEF